MEGCPGLVTNCGAVATRRGGGISIGKLSGFVYHSLYIVTILVVISCFMVITESMGRGTISIISAVLVPVVNSVCVIMGTRQCSEGNG